MKHAAAVDRLRIPAWSGEHGTSVFVWCVETCTA